jgi:hypothetical protein
MKASIERLSIFGLVLLSLGFSARAQNAPNAPESMRFFVTSVGAGKGGDLGGLTGADTHCQSLAAAVGAGSRTWQAYLSTQAAAGSPAVNARDRVGHGPWYNAKGTLIAREADRSDREGRSGQWPRGYAQHARHPDRLAAGRQNLPKRHGYDM